MFLALLIFLKALYLLIDQCGRLFNLLDELQHPCVEGVIRCQAELFDLAVFCLQCRDELVECCAVLFGFYYLCVGIYKVFIVTDPLFNLLRNLVGIPEDFLYKPLRAGAGDFQF